MLVDLGYVGRGTTTSARAKISVPGKGSVKITDIKSECDCIKVAGVKELPPGASEIAFTFAAPKDAQEYTKRFFVQTDHPELGRIIVTVRASIEMPLRITPAPLNLGTIATSKAVAGTITVTNLGPEPLRLLYATADHEGLSAEIPADAIKPGSSVKIPVSMNVSNARKGQGKAQVNIHTTCANQRVLLAFVTWHSSE